MVNFVNKTELIHKKYKTNGIVRDEHYKGKFLFPTKEFVSFGTYRQSMHFMSTMFLKENIYVIRVPQFQLVYIHDTTHTSHKICLSSIVKYILRGEEIKSWNYRSGRIA